jgi:hypothetical protein
MSTAHTPARQAAQPTGIAGLVALVTGRRRTGPAPRHLSAGYAGSVGSQPEDGDRRRAAGRGPDGRAPGGPSTDDDGDAAAPPRRLRPGAPGRDRRRQVEAELIGLRSDVAPDWWQPCWERGLDDGGLAPGPLFDALSRFHPDVRVVHGIAVTGTTAVIEHVLVGPGGVVVAGTEHCPGRVRTDGVHLRVRGRDRSPVIDLALWRAEVVRRTLETHGLGGVPVHGVVHWDHVEALGDRPVCLRGVPLLSAGATVGLAAAGIALSPLTIERIVETLTVRPVVR